MRQYVPWGRASEFPEINRRLTEEEYNEAKAYMEELGIVDGYTQAADSSDAVYIPAFNGAGVREPSKEEF